MQPIDWLARVADAIAHLQKPGRKLTPEAYCEIIDDVVNCELSAGNIAEKHGGRDPVITALGHVTTAVQGDRPVKPLSAGGWYEFKGSDQPYAVDAAFAVAWEAARG